MSRFLFVVLPLAGHVNPTWAVGQSLMERGHEVAWLGSESRLRPWLGPDATVFPTGMRIFRGRLDTGMAAVKSLWQGFVVPFARFTLPAVEKAIDAYRPDVLAVDQHALSGALAAQRRGLPWASLCSSSMELARPFTSLPKIEAWIQQNLASFAAWAGVTGDLGCDLRFSPRLLVAFTTRALMGGIPLPDRTELVGPALTRRPSAPGFPWDRLDPARRHVMVTVGTLAEDVAAEASDFYLRAAQALAPLSDRVQGILVAPQEAVPNPPGHLIAVPRVPQLELMPHLDAVVCHGGQNTVCEALNEGVPLVVAPLTRDQPINAAQVVAAGAGIRVRFGRARPDELCAAITTVLDGPRYRAAAARIRESFAAAGGAQAAAKHLEQLAPGAGQTARGPGGAPFRRADP